MAGRKMKLGVLAVLAVSLVGYIATAQQGRPRPPRQRPAARDMGADTVKSAAIPASDEEKKILEVLSVMRAKESRGMMNVPADDGRLLRVLAESLGAKNVVEIGTSNGYSGVWFALALRKTGGKLTTYEIDKGRAALARKNFKRAGVEKYITLIEGDAHKEVTKLTEKIDILFMDADKAGYVDYLKKLLPLVRPGGLIIAHNTTSHGKSMQPYLKAVTTDKNLETLFLNVKPAGVGVTLKKR
ncbi:MAG: O-methyltransferase [Phycisphaerae bacterium]|jgi:predicted O-methyltransferase YrrM|nr:O-methyltransferase [Phycisphaerae bacterium]